MIPLFRCFFWVGESDSDFIFTIWHYCHPHSGVSFHISGNGISIQSYTPVGGRQATPYRRLGFVGDALSITLRRGGLSPASRDHADQTSGTHYNTSLTLRETAQPNLTTPPFNPFFAFFCIFTSFRLIVGSMVPDIHAKFHNQPFIMRRAIWRHVPGHTHTHTHTAADHAKACTEGLQSFSI